jgi:hypothetical protein
VPIVFEKRINWIPESCDMPDLSSLTWDNIRVLMLNLMFRKGGPENPNARLLISTFVRLHNQTILEYGFARSKCLEYVSGPHEDLGPLLISMSHFENLISNLRRTIGFAEAIKRNRYCPKIRKDLSVFSQDAKDRIKTFRDNIHHMDEKLIDNVLQPETIKTINISSDKIELADIEITFIELASWIKQLNGIASTLAGYQINK